MRHKMIGLCFWLCNAMIAAMGLSLQIETISDVVRDPSGDFFSTNSDDCPVSACALNGRKAKSVKSSSNQCRCQCSESHPVLREDSKECVNQLECTLVNFIKPFLTEQMPVVSLPVSAGQLIHPGAHLILAGDEKAINDSKQLLCQMDGSDVMTPNGWQPIASKEGSHAFELFEDGNHTFLQWLSNDFVRKSLHQKLVLIRLFCSSTDSSGDSPVYKPCIAIRVGWAPGLSLIAGKESSDLNKALNSQNTNYSMIGLCLGLLGVMYVSALMIYMRSKYSEDMKYEERQITHRWPSDSEESQTTTHLSTTDITLKSGLRTHSRESSPEYDSININIETDVRPTTEWTQTSQMIENNVSDENRNNSVENQMNEESDSCGSSGSTQSSSTETPIYEKRLQKPDRIPRHCLRISPELFEPEMLLDPPPPAIEMLTKIRDLISMAKTRLRGFRYRPTLVVIPEDDYFYNESKRIPNNGVNSELESVIDSEDSLTLGVNEHIIDINDTNHSIKNSIIDSDIRQSFEQNNDLFENQNFELKDNDLKSKSFSRKQMLNNLQDCTQNINDLNFEQKSNISEKLIEVQDIQIEELDESHSYSDIHSLKVISSKVETDLHKNFEKQIFNESQVRDTSDKRMFSYFRNSLVRFGSKPKPKSDQVLVSSSNWTLQSANTSRKHRLRSMNQRSVVRKRITSRRGQLCYNCSDVSSLSGQQITDSYNDLEKPSLESNENNESMDSFDGCAYSDSERSTTSSTIRDNQLTSLESELNDYPSHPYKDSHNEDHSSIDECLHYLATASVDDNHHKYYQRIGRSSKEMSSPKPMRSGDYNHICHRSDSELEMSDKRSDSKTTFYSKNSKSKIKSSKSLNSNNRQKFKKKLALYKTQNSGVFNRTDIQTSSEINCCPTDHCCDQKTQNLVEISTNNSLDNIIDLAQNEDLSEDLSAHFVIRIKI